MKIVELLTLESLPHKDFFHINEVATLLNVKPHEIRYWEAEFPQIRSQKSRSGQRIYRRGDVIVFFAIKTLCIEKKLTVAGAQRILAQADGKLFAPINGHAEPQSESQSSLHTERKEEDDAREVKPEEGHQNVQSVGDQILEAASQLIGDDDDNTELDRRAQQIYSSYAVDLETVKSEVEAKHVGEMIHDAIAEHHKEQIISNTSQQELEKTLEKLTQSQNSLKELLVALDKYQESTWWNA